MADHPFSQTSRSIYHQLIRATTIGTFCNAQVLQLARQIAHRRGCLLMGTEHVLLAILTFKDTRCESGLTVTAQWLQKISKVSARRLAGEASKIVEITADAVGNTQDSHSLTLGLELATAIHQPAGTEHLLFGMLLAAETTGNANAASKICKGAEIIGQLQAACNVSAAQLIAAGRKCPGGVRQFGIIHLDPIAAVASAGAEPLAGGGGGGGGGGEAASASADAGTSAFTVPDAPVNMVGPVPKTHYVYNNLICGHSAGLMKTKDLEGLVDAGVNTFVCLQSSYGEYGCNHYPDTLRELARGNAGFPRRALRFIHCPVPDFGVLEDASLLALVQELHRELCAPGSTNMLYIHCMGGHGRTGTVVANLISAIDGVSFAKAMRTLKQCHAGRVRCLGRHCALNEGELEDSSQESQAKRLHKANRREHSIYNYE